MNGLASCMFLSACLNRNSQSLLPTAVSNHRVGGREEEKLPKGQFQKKKDPLVWISQIKARPPKFPVSHCYYS